MLKQTKIVATISDQRCEVDFIDSLYKAGMNVARLNTAHMPEEGLARVVGNIRKVLNRIGILIDTKGPEVRTTTSQAPIPFKTGETVKVMGNPDGETTHDCICVSYPDFVNDLTVGNDILIDDGDLEMKVVGKEADHLICEIGNDATLGSRKSVNVPGVRINLPSLTEKDRNNIMWAIRNDLDFIAHSFVRNKKDVLDIQQILDEHKSPINVTQEQLGGATVHASKSGVAHFAVDNEEEGLSLIRKLIGFMPQNNLEEAPQLVCDDPIDRLDDSLNDIIPDSPNKSYDMYEVIGTIIDNGEFLEVHRDFAQNIIVGFARFNGVSVGIVANQPKVMAGCLDSNASRKAARFVRFCDAFNIPLVTLVDVPGFLPGTGQEYNGVILHGAKLLFAYGEATVPKITITLRKSYGGAYCVMSSKHLRGDVNYAWPTAEIAVMGPAGAVEIIFAKEVASSEEPDKTKATKEEEYRKAFANPYNAARYGYIDDVIEPRNTRFRIIRALEQLQTKKLVNSAKKHDNLSL